MEGRRPKLRIVRRPQRHWFRVPSTQTVVLTSLVLLSVATEIWRFQQGERISFFTEGVKTWLFEHLRPANVVDKDPLHTGLKKFELEVPNLPRIWTNPQIHFTNWTRLFLFLFIVTGWKNLKELVEIMCYIFRQRNKTALYLFLFLMVWASIVVYIFVPTFYELCISLTQYILTLSVMEVNNKYMGIEVLGRIEKSHQDVAPYFTINLTRYNMEDVIMACRFVVSGERDVPGILKSFRWVKDNVHKLSKTERIHINTTAYRWDYTGSVIPAFLIESKLTIAFLDDIDYGKYSCRYSRTKGGMILPGDGSQSFEQQIPFLNHLLPYHDQPQKYVIGLQGLQKIVETFSNFHVEKRVMPIHEVIIPPGGLFIEHVPYWSLADPGDIIINETIWDKDNDECCSWSAWLYKFLFGYKDLLWRDKFGLGRQRYLIRQKCVCVEDFALKNKTFSIFRYNSTSKRQQVLSIHYPQQLILVPNIPNIGLFKIETGKNIPQPLFDDFVTCANGSDTSSACKKRLESTRDMSTDATRKNFYFHSVCCIILFILARGVHSFCLKWLWTYLISPLIRFSMDPLPVERLLPLRYDHDLYMTYDETDEYEREVAQRLKHRLEITGCRVFDACEDILPGFPELHAREEAIRSSALFCLFISPASQDDGQTILEHTAIKQTLADRKTASTETEDCKFIIQIGDCASDGFLIPGNFVVSESARQNYELDESILSHFLSWTRRSMEFLRWVDLKKVYGVSISRFVIASLITIVLENWVSWYRPSDHYMKYIFSNEQRKVFYEPENWSKN